MRYFNYNLATSLEGIWPDDASCQTVVNCLNPHSFIVALDDDQFRSALEEGECLLPDGEGVCLTLKWFKKERIQKIAGDDLHRWLLEKLEAKAGRVYYMGSSQTVLDAIEKRLHREYPHVKVRTWSPSYDKVMSDSESATIIQDINAYAPDVLLVGMTAPKQEKWVAQHRKEIEQVRVIGCIGAVFEFYAGTVKRAPDWAVKMKIEWLVRLLKEPKRMWKRNFVSTPKFLFWVWKNRKQMDSSKTSTR